MHVHPWYTRPRGLALIAVGALVTLAGLVWSPHVRLFEQSVGLAREAEPLAGFTSLLVAVVALAAWGLSYRSTSSGSELTSEESGGVASRTALPS